MSLWDSTFGIAEPTRTILSGTGSTVVLAANKSKQPIAKIHICNVSAGAVIFDIEAYDGTTIYYLEKGRSLPANSSYEIRDEILQNDHSLRVKAGAGNALHVTVLSALPQRS